MSLIHELTEMSSEKGEVAQAIRAAMKKHGVKGQRVISRNHESGDMARGSYSDKRKGGRAVKVYVDELMSPTTKDGIKHEINKDFPAATVTFGPNKPQHSYSDPSAWIRVNIQEGLNESNNPWSDSYKRAGSRKQKSGPFKSKAIGNRVTVHGQDDFGEDTHSGKEGKITRAAREHTFSAMVPWKILYKVEFDDGESAYYRRENVKKVKTKLKEAAIQNPFHKGVNKFRIYNDMGKPMKGMFNSFQEAIDFITSKGSAVKDVHDNASSPLVDIETEAGDMWSIKGIEK